MQSQLGSMVREVSVDTVELESHIQLVKSETVARAVVKKLNLAAGPGIRRPPGRLGWLDLPIDLEVAHQRAGSRCSLPTRWPP